jgi:hypothetical protein
MTTRAKKSIKTKRGFVVTDPRSPLLSAAEHGVLMARLGRVLDGGASVEARRAYAAEEMRLATERR